MRWADACTGRARWWPWRKTGHISSCGAWPLSSPPAVRRVGPESSDRDSPRRPEAADSAVQFAEPRDALRTGLGDGNGRDGSATTHAAFTVTLLLTADRRAASSWWTSGTGSGFATIDRNILHLESMLHKRDEVRSENALVYVHEFAAPCSIC